MLVGDNAGARQTLEEYFTTQYMWQIVANGDQVSPGPDPPVLIPVWVFCYAKC